MALHIDNRRLFDVAAGQIKLLTAETQHLHECSMCQAVLNIFLQQYGNGKSESAGEDFPQSQLTENQNNCYFLATRSFKASSTP